MKSSCLNSLNSNINHKNLKRYQTICSKTSNRNNHHQRISLNKSRIPLKILKNKSKMKIIRILKKKVLMTSKTISIIRHDMVMISKILIREKKAPKHLFST